MVLTINAMKIPDRDVRSQGIKLVHDILMDNPFYYFNLNKELFEDLIGMLIENKFEDFTVEGKKLGLAFLSIMVSLVDLNTRKQICKHVLGAIEGLKVHERRIIRKFAIKCYNDWILSVQP